MKIDKAILRDKAYLLKFYGEAIARNADRIDAVSRTRKNSVSIAREVNNACSNIREYSRFLARVIEASEFTRDVPSDTHDDWCRSMAERYREIMKEWSAREANATPSATKTSD